MAKLNLYHSVHVLQVMADSKVKLTEAGYLPGDPFPKDETIRECECQLLKSEGGSGLVTFTMCVHWCLNRVAIAFTVSVH